MSCAGNPGHVHRIDGEDEKTVGLTGQEVKPGRHSRRGLWRPRRDLHANPARLLTARQNVAAEIVGEHFVCMQHAGQEIEVLRQFGWRPTGGEATIVLPLPIGHWIELP